MAGWGEEVSLSGGRGDTDTRPYPINDGRKGKVAAEGEKKSAG